MDWNDGLVAKGRRPKQVRRSGRIRAGLRSCAVGWGLLVAGGLANPLPGQATDEDLYAGAHVGRLFDTAPSFSESICPDENTLLWGAHFGYQLLSFLGVEAGFSSHHENPDFCVNGLIPPPPENGTRTLRQLDEGIDGYQFVTPEGRLRLRSPRFGGVVSAGLSAGGAWIPDKEIGVFLAGLGVRASFGRLSAGLDLERWWFDVPFTDLEQTFRDGELVSERAIPGEFSENPVLLRAGVQVVPF